MPLSNYAVALVGEVARDHERVDVLLSANIVVILLPNLQAEPPTLPPPCCEWAEVPVSSTVATGGLRVDLMKRLVLWGQRRLSVSERELAILARLSEEPVRARTFAELAEPVESEGGRWFGDTERVHSAIKRLRKKLAKVGAEARIESVRGYGFRLVGQEADSPKMVSVERPTL